MDDANNMDNDAEAEVEVDAEIAAAAEILAEAAIEERELKLTSLLDRKKELPLRTRNKLNALVADLLTHTKDDIHDMLCDNNANPAEYQGLDSNRDTVAEVETAIRFFPEVLSLPTVNLEYPIQRLCQFSNIKCNVKAVSFFALLGRLAIEFHSFEDHERGGLLIDGTHGRTLYCLVDSSPQGYGEEHDQLVDNLFLRLLVQLRQMGLLIKEDIQEHQLTHRLLQNVVFAENRCQFLIQWDPTSLTQPYQVTGRLPLHLSAKGSTIREFQIVFEYGIRYYPNKQGITFLFQKHNTWNETPFQMACTSHGREKVMKCIEETLSRYSAQETPLLNIVNAFIMAAIDDDVHLDCVLFLMQREPDVIVKLLSGSINNNNTNTNSIVAGESGGGNHGSHDHDDDNDEDEDRKRKSRDDHVDNDNDDDNFNDGDCDIDNVNNTNNEVISRKRKRRG